MPDQDLHHLRSAVDAGGANAHGAPDDPADDAAREKLDAARKRVEDAAANLRAGGETGNADELATDDRTIPERLERQLDVALSDLEANGPGEDGHRAGAVAQLTSAVLAAGALERRVGLPPAMLRLGGQLMQRVATMLASSPERMIRIVPGPAEEGFEPTPTGAIAGRVIAEGFEDLDPAHLHQLGERFAKAADISEGR